MKDNNRIFKNSLLLFVKHILLKIVTLFNNGEKSIFFTAKCGLFTVIAWAICWDEK